MSLLLSVRQYFPPPPCPRVTMWAVWQAIFKLSSLEAYGPARCQKENWPASVCLLASFDLMGHFLYSVQMILYTLNVSSKYWSFSATYPTRDHVNITCLDNNKGHKRTVVCLYKSSFCVSEDIWGFTWLMLMMVMVMVMIYFVLCFINNNCYQLKLLCAPNIQPWWLRW